MKKVISKCLLLTKGRFRQARPGGVDFATRAKNFDWIENWTKIEGHFFLGKIFPITKSYLKQDISSNSWQKKILFAKAFNLLSNVSTIKCTWQALASLLAFYFCFLKKSLCSFKFSNSEQIRATNYTFRASFWFLVLPNKSTK